MKKFFYRIKKEISYFLMESEKPFFVSFFVIIICIFAFSFIFMIASYSETGMFFKESDYEQYSQMLEQKRIEFILNDDGEIYIVKKGPVDLNFDDISFVDEYYSYEYKVIFPGDYFECFEKDYFEVNNDFVSSVYVEKDSGGKTVLRICEKDIFGFEVFSKGPGFLRISMGDPKDIYDKIVVIDPGHGGADFGVNDGSSMEKDITLEVCKRVQDLFRNSKKVKVYLTRNSDDYLQDEKRVFFANQYADLFLSIHLNAVDSYNYSDKFKIICNDSGNDDNYELSKNYSEIFKNAILKYISSKDFEFSDETKFILTNAQMPAVFMKMAYNSNFGVSNYADSAAMGVYDGINKIFE